MAYRYRSCLRCGRIFPFQRSTKLTCSNACKQWVYRHPEHLEEWKIKTLPHSLALFLEYRAHLMLLPGRPFPDTYDEFQREIEYELTRRGR